MFCTQCGTANADSGRFCVKCGAELGAGIAPPATAASEPGIFAGFWIRLAAYLIDYLILLAGLVAVSFVGGLLVSVTALVVAYLFASFVLPWLYTAILESGEHQATWGKRAVGIKVTDLQGERISFGRATGRFFAEWVTGFTLGIGYVMAAFTSRRQALHDMIASTYVVRAAAEPNAVAVAPPMARPPAALIVLAVLATSVPLIGIFAAIAIPAYQDYTIRAQVSEGLVMASDVKAGVAEYAAQTGTWPPDLAEAGLARDVEAAVDAARYVDSIDLANGTITITYGKQANSRIRNGRLSLRPFATEAGDVAWQCGHAEVIGIDESGSDVGRTDIAGKHLPAACRAATAMH